MSDAELARELQADAAFKGYLQRFYDAKIRNFREETLLELELTNRCRVNCGYCGIHSGQGPRELGLPELKEAIRAFRDQAFASGFSQLSLSLSGGDPLLYSRFRELVEFLSAEQLRFGLKANPSSLTAELAAFLKGSACRTVKMTFMGRPPVHDRYRGLDSYEQLVEKTGLLRDSGIPVVWHYSVGRFNAFPLQATLEAVLAGQPAGLAIGRIARIGKLRGDRDSFPEFSPEEYRAFLTSILVFFYKNKRRGFNLMFREKLWVPLLSELGLLEVESWPRDRLALGCDGYSRLLTLSYEGQYLPCGLLPALGCGSLYEGRQALRQALARRPLDLQAPSPCHSCRFALFCRGCRGMACGGGGGLYARDPQCWRKGVDGDERAA